jgi:hypothetical protein
MVRGLTVSGRGKATVFTYGGSKLVAGAPVSGPLLDEFRRDVLKQCRFLVERGFRRAEEYEARSSMGTCVAFVGKHIGFSFYTDLRDQHVGVQVFNVVDGRRPPSRDGGHASDLWKLLVRGVRHRSAAPTRRRAGAAEGSAPGAPVPAPGVLKDWVLLLRTAGAWLLADEPGSVPG